MTAIDITGIVVLVPAAGGWADNPHVTLLAPFRPRDRLDRAVRDQLHAYFATVRPFDFVLADERAFPDGHRYLAPEPQTPFRMLTLELADRYPDCPPYEGQFDDVIPHLTITNGVGSVPVPITTRADKAHLVHSYDSAWDVLAEFPFAE
jgi:hypothetical protein